MNEDPPGYLITLAEHEEIITDLENELWHAFEENVINYENPTQDLIITSVRFVFDIRLPEEESYELARALVRTLLEYDTNTTNHLQKLDVGEDLTRLLLNLGSASQADIRDVFVVAAQGERFWRSVSTEYTLRNEGSTVGMRHTIENGRDEEFVLTTSVASNMHLISLLVQKQISAMNIFGEELIDEETYSHIRAVSEQVEELEAQMPSDTK